MPPSRRIRFVAIAAALACFGSCASGPAPKRVERRSGFLATWVVRTDLVDKRSIERVVDEAIAGQVNALFVQVRGRGDAYYLGGIEPLAEGIAPGFDPLSELIGLARPAGIEVHAWINVFLLGGLEFLHPDARHGARARPEWIQIPPSLAGDLLPLPPGHAGFLPRIQEHARASRGEAEGLYADPLSPSYREHVAAVARDLSARYEIDGLHLDYVRYPGQGYGITREALDRFRVEVDRELSGADRRDMAARIARDPLVYTRRYPVRWSEARRHGVSQTVRAIALAARSARPGIQVSAAVVADIQRARDHLFQDWTRWMSEGVLDAVCPMNYSDANRRSQFEDRARAAVAAKGRGRLYMGIGAYLLPLEETLDRVRFSRLAGADGAILFSQGSLRDQPGAFARLAEPAAARP